MPTLARHVLQWGLVCERAYIAPLVTTVYFCGVMLGGVIFGGLSDRLGRKWVMLFCLYSQCTIGIGLHFVQRLAVFMGLRFVQGILIQVQYSTLQYSTVQYRCPHPGPAVRQLQHDHGALLPRLQDSRRLRRRGFLGRG